MTLKEYIQILNKTIGDVKITTSKTDELNTISVEDKIVSFDSKIIVSDATMNTVKYKTGDDNVTIIASIKVPKNCKWVGVFKIALDENQNIAINLNIITNGSEDVDVNDLMDQTLNTFIKL